MLLKRTARLETALGYAITALAHVMSRRTWERHYGTTFYLLPHEAVREAQNAIQHAVKLMEDAGMDAPDLSQTTHVLAPPPEYAALDDVRQQLVDAGLLPLPEPPTDTDPRTGGPRKHYDGGTKK